MKTHLTFSLVAACLTFAPSELAAQEQKGETLRGVVESVDGNNITVNHRRKSRTFTINDQTKINFVSFLEAKKEIKPGFFLSRRRRFQGAMQSALGHPSDPGGNSQTQR